MAAIRIAARGSAKRDKAYESDRIDALPAIRRTSLAGRGNLLALRRTDLL